ncbi:MAG: DNA internalization-related competence protein ComEC/Rec2 [Bacilli bacterium]|nr:DNA internalization-related competence protein ComEC/Rec2 [Bacilli bacterium]
MKRLKIILQCDYFYLILIFVVILYVLIYVYFYAPKSIYNINDKEFILTINDYKIDGDKLSISFKENLVGTYYFNSLEEKQNFNYNFNDKVYVIGILSIPKNNTIFNLFNYKDYLYHKGVKYTIMINRIGLVSQNSNIFYKIKNYVYKRIKKLSNEYLYAFVLGETFYIDNDVYNGYRINGITHLFSLSALHISVFSSILYFVLNKFKLNEIISLIIVSLFLIFFSFISSFSPSMLRALIFFILNSLNHIFNLNVKTKNILYITLCILLLINPNYIFNIGFRLSFVITFFIILFSEKYKIKNRFLSLIVISFISFLAGFPMVINLSYEINIIGFISNFIFIPLVTYVLFPLSLISFLFSDFAVLLDYISKFMEIISLFFSRYINISFVFSSLNLYEIIIYYVLLYVFVKKKKFLVFFVYICFLFLRFNFNKNDYIYFLDVSQGDSSLILSNNKSILIDTGGKVSYEKEEWRKRNNEYNLMISSLIPFFKSIGLKRIDYLILTHGDYDHMGEAINLVNNFNVEKVIFNCGEFNDLEQDLIEVLKKKKIPYYSCIKKLNIDKNKLYFLNNGDYGNENDNSSVIYTELNNHKFLFMGDAGVDVEEVLIEKYNLQDIDVLKVGHHGSKTSSSKTFIDVINPKYSIISVGENNRYGHPNKEVLNVLENSKIYRTDKQGSIMIKIDNKLIIETCGP